MNHHRCSVCCRPLLSPTWRDHSAASSQKTAVAGTKNISLKLGPGRPNKPRPKSVKIHGISSSTITLNTGSPQGCVLSPLLYTLLSHDCSARYPSNHRVKFVDDTTAVGLISTMCQVGTGRRWKNLWTGGEQAVSASMWGRLRRSWTSGGKATMPASVLFDQAEAGRPAVLTSFYNGMVKSIPVWYGNCFVAKFIY